MQRGALASFAMCFFGQRVNSGGIDPPVVEVEQCADGDREVDRFFVPADRVQRLHVVRRDVRRFRIHLSHETKQSFVFFLELRAFQVADRAVDQLLIPEQFRRNCGV